MTNSQPIDQPSSDRCADIAAALHTIAMRFTDLIGTGTPVPYVQLNIQPGRHGDDEPIVAAVDAVTSALLGHTGQVQQMGCGGFHYNNGDDPESVGAVDVRIFNGVSPEYVAKRDRAARETEMERLRAEIAALRAAAKVGTAAEHLPDPAPEVVAAGMAELTGEVRAAKAEEPECTPECDALYTNITKTGGDRQWHHDECPWAKILDDGPKWTCHECGMRLPGDPVVTPCERCENGAHR